MVVQNSSIRRVMLQAKLEGLMNKNNKATAELFAQKFATVVDLAKTLPQQDNELLLLSSSRRPLLTFSPHVKALAGAIGNKTAVVLGTAVLLFGVLLTSFFLNTYTPKQSQVAKAEEVTSITQSEPSSDQLNIQEAYLTLAKEKGYGEEVFTVLKDFSTLTLEMPFGKVDLAAEYKHVDYSVSPGQKGHSLLLSSSANSLFRKLVPGDRVFLQTSQGTYRYIYITDNTYSIGDSALLSNTQKSLLQLIEKDSAKIRTFQFRLIGFDSK